MAKEYVPIFLDWLEVTQDLLPEEKGNLIDAVIAYAAGLEYEHYLSGGCKIAFRFLKGQVDRNNAISDQRSKAGSNKKEQTEAKENKQEQTETKENKREQTESNLPKEKEKDKEKENNKENNKEKSGRFTPPTIEQVKEYCQERGNAVDPDRWFNYYSSNGWKVGKNPMKDWKAAVRTWEINDKQDNRPAGKVVQVLPAQNYNQRSYNETKDVNAFYAELMKRQETS